MRTSHWIVALVLVVAAASGAAAESVAGLPLHVEKLAPHAVRLWIGDHVSSTAVVAIGTEKGIVVVDTTGIPSVDTTLRAVIARELGRSDFATLINTHEHADHTGGNSVYADCTIVAHARCEEGMQRQRQDLPRLLEFYAGRTAELEAEVTKLPADSAEAVRLREDLTLLRLNRQVLESGLPPAAPTVTFTDRMTMDMGDTTFELYFIGGMHSSSDIAVLVPELGLLMTGDTMADIWFTDTPGCLASFMARPGVHHDFPRLLDNWEALLARKDEIRDFVPGHWNGDLSFDGFTARVEYVRTLWEGINGAAEDTTLEDLFASYRLDAAFPDLVGSPGFDPRTNAGSILEIWTTVTGQQSAALALYDAIDQDRGEYAVREILAERGADKPRYYFIEGEINGHGYRFLREGRVDRAVAMFRLNAELYPESWNVYDSLGEALLLAGDATAAAAMYERSIALNPDNTNGSEALARIRSGEAAPGA